MFFQSYMNEKGYVKKVRNEFIKIKIEKQKIFKNMHKNEYIEII